MLTLFSNRPPRRRSAQTRARWTGFAIVTSTIPFAVTITPTRTVELTAAALP
jgi:hypothetical protein